MTIAYSTSVTPQPAVVAKFASVKFDPSYQGGQTFIIYRPVQGDNSVRVLANGKAEVIKVNGEALVCGSDNFAVSAVTYGHNQIRLYYVDDVSQVRELVGQKEASASVWKWTAGDFDKGNYRAEGGTALSASCDVDATLSVVFVAAGQKNGFTKVYVKAGGYWNSEVLN